MGWEDPKVAMGQTTEHTFLGTEAWVCPRGQGVSRGGKWSDAYLGPITWWSGEMDGRKHKSGGWGRPRGKSPKARGDEVGTDPGAARGGREI